MEGRSSKKKSSQKQYTVEQLLAKAEELLLAYNPELAEKFYKRALEQEPTNSDALDAYGSFLLEVDRFDEAKEVFLKSIEVAPDADSAKYMNMGQLSEGQEAIKHFSRGIAIMEEQLNEVQQLKPSKSKKETMLQLRQQISAAYCSIAEVYLTDECFEEQAESECERVLNAAISFDPDNAEPLQTLASVRMSQQRAPEALELMNKSYSKWRDLEHDEQPSLEFRHNAAKLLLEMDQHETAAEIWEIIIEEDDSIAEVYYFLGLSYKTSSPTDCFECATKAKQLLVASQCDDALLQQQVDELLAEADAAVKGQLPSMDADEGDDAEDGDDGDDGGSADGPDRMDE
eukprot:TRINITY_DN10064_c0_g1_i1.p1 TRINITY_DN10064_c0_g1~~TRINITY_DN10064_c0_g1_i1.p1  ORF type:complete len:365 (-),score=101.14 TRINITY_DN10064_c0_g1_i1:291-1322(-)